MARQRSWHPAKWVRIGIPAMLICLWLAMAGVGGPYFGRIEEVSDVDLAAFLPKSAEATRVNEELKRFRDDTTIPAIIIATADDGVFDEAEETVLNDRRTALEKVDGVSGEISLALISEDKKAAIMVAQTDTNNKVVEVLEGMGEALSQPGLEGMHYRVTGPAGFAADLTKAFGGIDGILLLTALVVVFVILVIVYRSILLPFIVLLTSMAALAASILIVWNFANAGLVQLNGQVQGILFILVIGAATDYSLLYIARYREELYREESKWTATHEAMKGALEPILASGSTVIAGLLCLLLSDLASNKALGPVGAIGIVLAMAASLTLLPALLYAIGRRSFWPARVSADTVTRRNHEAKLRSGIWHQVGRLVSRRPRAVWVVCSVLLLAACLGYFQLKANGVDQSRLIIGESDARKGQELLTKHFPAGSGSPIIISTDLPHYERVVRELDSDKGIDGVAAIADNSPNDSKPLGKQAQTIRRDIREEVQKTYDEKVAEVENQRGDLEAQVGPYAAQAIIDGIKANIPSVDSIVAEAYPFKDAQIKAVNDKVMLQATLTDAPDSRAAKNTVERVRELVKNIDTFAMVGGPTAIQLDTLTASQHDRMVIIPVVLAVITVILMILLRAVVAPLLLLITTVVSFGSSLGVAALLFNHVWKFPGVDPTIVLYGFVFLVALGIDYNIFLMTRVREESLRSGTQAGVVKGLVITGGVITSAGVVLAATFAALAVIPILFLVQLAFIVAFGVLLDTIVVRSLLVPALIKDIGSKVWWPSRLQHKK